MEIKTQKNIYRKKTNKKSTKKTEWKEYETEMEARIQVFEEERYKGMGIQDRYKLIVENMREAVEIATYGKVQKESERRQEHNRESSEINYG